MKKVIRLSMMMAMFSIAIMGCKNDLTGDKKDAKLSPPSWIQGDWGYEGSNHVMFRFTGNDVLMNIGVLTSLNSIYGYTVLGYGTTLKETKNSNSEYEIKVTGTVAGKEQAVGRFHFKKLDGNRIEAGTNEDGDTITDWEILVKK